MSSVLLYLPTEIWHGIAGFLPKNDVVRLSNANSHFTSILRPLFYRKVFLCQVYYQPTGSIDELKTRSDIDATLALLARDGDLAGAVSNLSLLATNERLEEHPSLIKAMRNMTGLKRLELESNGIFNQADDLDNVNDTVCDVLHGMSGLEDFVLRSSPAGFSSQSGLSVSHLEKIQNLKRVEWESLSSDVSSLHSLLSVSLSSLSTLHITLFAWIHEIQTRLFSLRFPQLESLTLRDRTAGDPLGELFVTFLIAHDQLTHLDLGYLRRSRQRSSALTLDGIPLNTFRANASPLALPRLKSFCGDVSSFKLLAQTGLNCLLTTLERVYLNSGVHRPELFWHEITQMCLAIGRLKFQTRGRIEHAFSALKEFGLYSERAEDLKVPMQIFVFTMAQMIAQTIRPYDGREGSTIEIWGEPYPITDMDKRYPPEFFGSTFNSIFPRLRVVHFDYRLAVDGPEEWVRRFVGSCGEKVETVNLCSLGEVVESWAVGRGGKTEANEASVRIWLDESGLTSR
ncbi:hypothetical protein E1B28_006442 [Marasmius oreades]|uniref:F-box domain-containing protein n=1 Tax=Marasmius oreades TaxID=181124 RepID=A0A9P7UVA1_9AGAR|nr:uncharacterized protein E1B28_006442 [Marasmius oreades]KAG7095732.1 hypothetical protein E1B28_006442 [Marasmius oreades]